MDNLKFEIKKVNNQVIPCEVIFTFENNNTKYVIYTDNKKDENGDLNILASRYEEKEGKIVLSNIENEEEFVMIDKIIALKIGDAYED